MLCFSDYILSQKPWSHCRMNEPEGNLVYLDISGNENHLYSQKTINGYSNDFNNEQDLTYNDGMVMKGVKQKSLNRILCFNQLDWNIPLTSLQFRIPEFKSDTIFYIRHDKIQNSLFIGEYWLDFIWNPHPESIVNSSELVIYEEFVRFGPLKILSESLYSENYIQTSLQLKIITKDQVIWSKDILNDPFSSGNHRFTIGLKQVQGFIKFRLSIDGNNPIEINFTGVLGGHEEYSNIAFYNQTIFSNISIFFNKAFPTNEWLIGSQKILESNYLATTTDISSILNEIPGISIIEGSLYSILDTLFFIGNRQTKVLGIHIIGTPTLQMSSLEFSPLLNSDIIINSNNSGVFNGCYNVIKITKSSITLSPIDAKMNLIINYNSNTYTINDGKYIDSLILEIVLEYNHPFKIGDNVSIGRFGIFNYTWKVKEIDTLHHSFKIQPDIFESYLGISFDLNEISEGEILNSFLLHDSSIFKPSKMSIGENTNLNLTINPSWKLRAFSGESINCTFDYMDFLSGETMYLDFFNLSFTNYSGEILNIKLVTDESEKKSWYLSDTIIKIMPFGGGNGWSKILNNHRIEYLGKTNNSIQKILIVNDTNEKYASLSVSNSDGSNESEILYFPRFINPPSKLNSYYAKWKAIGDQNRFYFFFPPKTNRISHGTFIAFGEIKNWVTNSWITILVASKTNSGYFNPGFNLAFTYSKWSILSEGYLLCELDSVPQSDGYLIEIENDIVTESTGILDSGYHIYPIPFPYIPSQ